MGKEKVLVGQGKILLADKIIYLAAEFRRLAEADFVVVAYGRKLPIRRQQPPQEYILKAQTDGFLLFEKLRICISQKTFRLIQKLHLR